MYSSNPNTEKHRLNTKADKKVVAARELEGKEENNVGHWSHGDFRVLPLDFLSCSTVSVKATLCMFHPKE